MTLAKKPLLVALGPADASGNRKVRAVVSRLQELPSPLPEGFITVPLSIGSEIPEKSSSYKTALGFFADPERKLQEQARARASNLLEAWTRLRDLSGLQAAYPLIDFSQELAQARADLAAEEARLPPELRGGGS